jgi:ABC-type dipeptide/oligopeptide/nickel transport system permease subunit
VLGTDFLGRDVLSRVLWGGRSVLALAGAATLLAYLAGGATGLIAGYRRGLTDGVLMRGVDVMLSVPALIFLLVLVTGAGTSAAVLVAGVALVQAPLVARVVRTATLEQAVKGFVEAAEARGESTLAIVWRELLPNIAGPLFADVGLRFTYSIILVASVNFLGLGLQPPAADWALIVSENRSGLDLNPYAILAPALLIAVLTIAVNLVGDAIARGLGRSSVGGPA